MIFTSTTPICSSCGREADPVNRDMGIGPYEYWGFRGTDHNWQWVSPCCEAECQPGGITYTVKTVTARKDYPAQGIRKDDHYEFTHWHSWITGGRCWYGDERRKR